MFSVGIFLLRIVTGLGTAAHGAQKLFGFANGPGIPGFRRHMDSQGMHPAHALALLAGLAEFLGGLGVALGLLTPLAAFAVISVMIVAIGTAHFAKGFFIQQGGFEYPLVLATTMLCIAVVGPGVISFDNLLNISFPEPLFAVVALGVTVIVTSALLLAAERRREKAVPLAGVATTSTQLQKALHGRAAPRR
jgi:putative oxidoreductase